MYLIDIYKPLSKKNNIETNKGYLLIIEFNNDFTTSLFKLTTIN